MSPPDLLALVQIVLQHPATWACGSVALGALASAVLSRQLRAIGLADEHERGLRWSGLLSMLMFWVVTLAGLATTSSWAGWSGAAGVLARAAGVALAMFPAAVMLAAASRYARERTTAAGPDAEEVEIEVRWVRLAAGLLAAITVAQAEAFAVLLGVLLIGAAVWLAGTPSARDRLSRWWRQAVAGQRLRQRASPDAKLVVGGREVALLGQFGFFDTLAMADDLVISIPNTELLAALLQREPAPPRLEG